MSLEESCECEEKYSKLLFSIERYEEAQSCLEHLSQQCKMLYGPTDCRTLAVLGLLGDTYRYRS